MAGDVQIRVNIDGANDAARDLSQIDRELASLSGSADQAGKAFQGLSRFTSAAHLERFRDTFRDTGVQVNNASKEIDQLASRMQRVARDNAFRQLAQDANLSHTQIARLRAQMGDYSGALSSLGAAVGQHKVAILAAGAAMVAFGKSCLDAQIEMERLEQSYKAVFGAQASAQLKAVYEQANRVGLKFQETAEAAKGFFAAGQGTALEKDLQSIFKAVTDSGAALQLSTDEVNGALVALGQMMSKGKVQAEELRGQLGERLPGAFQMAAKAMGMTTAELDKFMADGKLTAEDLLPKLAAALEEQYGAAAERAANTVQGSINRMETEWMRFKARIMDSGPVVFAVKFITEYLKAGNDAADIEAQKERRKKWLEEQGIKYDTSSASSNTALHYLGKGEVGDYSQKWYDYAEIQERQEAYLKQYHEGLDRAEEKAIAERRNVIDTIYKGDTGHKNQQKNDALAEHINKLEADTLELKKKGLELTSVDAARIAENEKAIASARKQQEELNKKIEGGGKAGKSAAAAAKNAAVSQAGYNGEIERTEQHIKSLQQQLNLDKTETLTAAKIKAEEKYQDTISKTNEELAKRLARKEISSTQADEIRKLKEQEASLQKQYDIRNATTKASQKQAQITQGQLKFYKELGQLSGNYGNTVELQNGLIEEQAQKYRDIYGISEDLVAQWEYYQKLQISTDPFDGALRGLLRFSNEYQDQGKVWEDLTYNFSKSFVDQTGDMFGEFLETGKTSLDGFKDLFKSFLKQLAWQAVAQPIMVNIMGSLMGSSSGGVASAAGLMGGGSNDLIGTTTNAFFSAGGQGGGIMDVGLGIGKNYASRQLFGGESGLIGGITDTINSTVSSMMPSMFAGSQNIATANIASNAFFEAGGASAALPTTTFTSAIGTAGIGGMVGGIASPFVNSLFGVENNQGSQVGSMIGGGLGTVGGAMMAAIPAMAAIPGIGWIGAGVAALGSIVGGLIGGGLGTQPKQEPKLEVDLVGSLWKPVSDARDMQVFDNGGPIAAWDPNTGAYRSAVETSHGAKGSWDITTAYGNVMQQVAETSWGIADALGTITDDMKTQYLKNLEELGEINIHGIHRGDWINQNNIQAFADWYVGEATGNMLIALSNIDLTPLTIAADGMAADTAEELGTAIGNILSYVNIGQAIEDETMRNNFYDSIQDQMVNALDKVSLAPLTIAADGFAVDTVDELSTALKDVFTSYDLGETIQDEDLKAAYQAKMQELIESAFDGIDLSFLRVDFDQNSFAGLQQAYAAIQAWEQVEDNINAVLKPTSDFVIQIEAASNQFDEWIKNLKALGWQEEAVAEVEAKRTDYMRELANNLSAEFGMFMGQTSELAASIKNAEATFDGWIDSLDKLGYSEEEIASVEARRADYLRDSVSSLTAGLDAFFNPVAEFDIAMQQAASQFDTWIASLGRLGYTQEEIIRLEGRRTEYLLEQARALREADLQNLTLRITALAKGSDSSAYNLQSLQFQQSGELESMASKYGKDSDIYSLTKNIQAIEMMQAQLDALVSERNKLFEKQIAGINKQIEANKEAMKPVQAQIKANQNQEKLLQRQLKLEQKKAQELQKQISVIEKDINAKEREIDDIERAIDQWRDLLDDMRKFRRELWASESNLMGTRYQETYNQFDSLYERAMQGDQDALSELQSKATDLLAIGREQLESRGEYNDAFYDVDLKLKAAQEYAARQVYEEEKQLDVLKGQLAELELQRDVLQGQLDGINSQIELLNGQIEKLNEQNELLNDEIAKIEALNEPLYAQIEELQKQQATLNEQLTLEEEGNLTLDQINSGISGLQAAIAQQTAALVQRQQAISNSGSSGNFLGKYATEAEFLAAKTNQVNSINFGGRNDWTASQVKDAIQSAGGYDKWYQDYGKAEGFAEGGITPANRIYMVGERGPELMMSPRQWGVLNNEATQALFERESPQMPYIPIGIDMSLLVEIREGLSELVSISRQSNAKLGKIEYSTDKSLSLFRNWEADGIGIAEEKAA